MALLNEVVLFRPVETVLEPWLKRAPNDAVRQWMLTVLRNWLMKSPNDLYKLPYLPVTADEKQKKAYSFSDLYDVRLSPTTEGDLEHIMDFFKNNPDLPRLGRMSVENVHQAADEWVKAMNAKAKKQPDNPKEVKTMIEFPGGYRMVDLIGKTALSKEGGLMHHCVGGGTYWDAVKSGKSKIYSLRDGNNHPCVTIEVDVRDNSTEQIKGHGNQAPVRRYWPMLKAFFQQTGIQVTGDYRNVGLLRIYDGDRWFNITQDQFKDLLLDPQNQEGQKLLSYYQQHGGDYGSGLDLALGIFTSLYGTDRLTDGVIRVVFSQMPVEAVQTVEQFGNRLTQAQINVAFASLPRRQRELPGLYKRLLTATKPTDEEIRTIIQALVDESDADFERAKANNRNGYGPYRRNYNYDVTFVTALAEATPALYRRLVGTPEAVMAELAAKNDRQIGPFYAFVGDPQMPADLAPYVPEMIAKAFRNDPAAAGAHLKAKNFVFNEHTAFAALDGCSQAYWDRENTNLPTLEWLIQVTKPDEKTVNAVFSTIMSAEHNKAEFAKVFLKVLQKEAPEAISQTIHEKALRVINDKGLIENYLTQQPHPTLEFQNFLFQGKEHFMAWVQNVDPSFFARVLEMLRPSAINPEKEDYKNVPDRAKRKNPQTSQDTHAIKQIKFKRPKTPEERAAAINAERSKVTNRFLEYLAPLIKEPDSGTNEINQQSAKYKVGKKAFEQLGKGKLFDLATRMLDAKNLHAAIIGGAYKGLDSMNPSLLLQRLDSIPDRDLVKIIDAAGYNADLLPYVINHAPQRMPGIMLAHKYRHNYRAGHVQWGDLKFKNLDKNKTLAALEYVWADPRVPEGMKDDFTLKVFKRFKPPAAKLMQMLRSADDEKATEYVLKKTSKPSEELLMYVADEFPKLLEYAQNIPQPILAHLFASNIQLVVGLMNRDLRGYGKTSRRNWEAPNFHNRIDPSSEIFGRYQAAAKAAGKEAEFNRYVQQAQLDDKVRHRQDFTVKTGTGDERELNYEKVAEHINEFSDGTILQLAQQAKDRKAIVRLCFRYFGAKKLARLANMGLFGASEYNRDYVWVKRNPNDYWGKTERNKFLSTLNTKKVMEMAQILLNTEHVNRTLLKQLFLQLQAEGFEIDNDMLIKLLEKLEGSHNDIEPFLNDSLDATAKDWVADHQPYKMDHIQNPTPHMVTKLFDEFGGIEKREGKYRVEWMFSQIVFKWFSSGDGLWFHYRANPAASRLLIDEAKRRGGLAISIVASMLKKIGELRQKAANGEKTISTPHHVYLTMVPPGVKTKK